MHHIKWGEGLLLIITCTNLNTFWMKIVRLGKVSCCIMQGWQPQYHTASIWFDLLLQSSGCSTVLVLHPLDVEYIIHLVVNIYIICKHVIMSVLIFVQLKFSSTFCFSMLLSQETWNGVDCVWITCCVVMNGEMNWRK